MYVRNICETTYQICIFVFKLILCLYLDLCKCVYVYVIIIIISLLPRNPVYKWTALLSLQYGININ